MKNQVNIFYFPHAESMYGTGIQYATAGSVGLDLRACTSESALYIPPHTRVAIPTGIAIEILQENTAGFVYSRSGLGAVQGLTVAQGVGVIDKDYRGEIIVFLLNTSSHTRCVRKGDRIAQLVFQPAYQLQPVAVTTLSETERAAQGFGHTGKK